MSISRSVSTHSSYASSDSEAMTVVSRSRAKKTRSERNSRLKSTVRFPPIGQAGPVSLTSQPIPIKSDDDSVAEQLPSDENCSSSISSDSPSSSNGDPDGGESCPSSLGEQEIQIVAGDKRSCDEEKKNDNLSSDLLDGQDLLTIPGEGLLQNVANGAGIVGDETHSDTEEPASCDHLKNNDLAESVLRNINNLTSQHSPTPSNHEEVEPELLLTSSEAQGKREKRKKSRKAGKKEARRKTTGNGEKGEMHDNQDLERGRIEMSEIPEDLQEQLNRPQAEGMNHYGYGKLLKGIVGLSRSVVRFSKPPPRYPCTVCFQFPNTFITHRYVMDVVREKIHFVPGGEIVELQFIERNVIHGTRGLDNRWIITLNSMECRDELMRLGLFMFNKKILLRRYDEVLQEEYRQYLDYTALLKRLFAPEDQPPDATSQAEDDDQTKENKHTKKKGKKNRKNKHTVKEDKDKESSRPIRDKKCDSATEASRVSGRKPTQDVSAAEKQMPDYLLGLLPQ